MELKDDNRELLTLYLLGGLPEDRKRELENEYFANDALHDELRATERDLIDRYVRRELSETEKESFEKYFLHSPTRIKKLRLAMTLNDYISKRAAVKPPNPPVAVIRRAWLRQAYSSPYLRMAAFLVIAVGAGLGIYRMFFHQTEADEGLAALKYAYRNERSVGARISGFDYAPLPNTRGGQAMVDKPYSDMAERILLTAASKKTDAETRHALGKLYLARGQFDLAINEFEEALKMSPSNPRLHSDLGAALLEKGKADSEDATSGDGLRALGQGLEHLNKALELDGSILEALFNRALIYEGLMMRERAGEEWRKYLGKDPSSKWAEEARQHLKALEEMERSSLSPEELFRRFVSAYESGDEHGAWEAISQSQSGNGNFIIERLVDGCLSPGAKEARREADDNLAALSFAAGAARKMTGDGFISDLHGFYDSTPPVRRSELSGARELMRAGHRRFDESRLDEAIELYGEALRIFERAGNEPESGFAEFRIAHAHLRQPDLSRSLSVFRRLARKCEGKGYRWLLARTLNSIADAYHGQNRFSEALDHSRQSLELAESIKDVNVQIRNSIQLAQEYQSVANARESLRYLHQSFELADARPVDATQLRVIYGIAADCFSSIGLFAAAADYQREALRQAIETENPLLESRCYTNLAEIYGKMKKYDEALKSAQLAYDIGQRLSSEIVGREMMAFASLQFGHLYRQLEDFDKALESYDRNISIYNDLGFPAQSFHGHKGSLLCYLGLNDSDEAEKELKAALSLFEQSRSNISEESNRNAFFDNEQDIYDLAIDFMHSRKRDDRKAFEYSEATKARSLLDLAHSGASVFEEEYGPDLRLPSVATPLTLPEIQGRLPDRAQIVQYAVLEDRLLIWVVTGADFSSTEVNVAHEDLSGKVEEFSRAISHRSGNHEDALRGSKELYELLVRPVEQRLDKGKITYIVPDKILNHVPFNALTSTDSGRYLIHDYLFGFAPSSTIFIKCSEAARRKGGQGAETLLAVGNPTFDRAAFPSLRPLPDAAREARAVAGLYGESALLCGDEAKESRVRNHLAGSDVVHLATHYVPDENASMLSNLLLAKEPGAAPDEPAADGVLQPWEVYGIKLPRTRLVVLSACQTGIERHLGGEGAIGIARPFIVAEVPLIVASLWPVDSTSTAELMIRLHRNRKGARVSTVEALRNAQLEMLNDPDAQCRTPYCWASFIATGGHTTF